MNTNEGKFIAGKILGSETVSEVRKAVVLKGICDTTNGRMKIYGLNTTQHEENMIVHNAIQNIPGFTDSEILIAFANKFQPTNHFRWSENKELLQAWMCSNTGEVEWGDRLLHLTLKKTVTIAKNNK